MSTLYVRAWACRRKPSLESGLSSLWPWRNSKQVGGSHTARIQDEFRRQQFTLADASRLQSNQKWGSGGVTWDYASQNIEKKNLELLKVSCNSNPELHPRECRLWQGTLCPSQRSQGPTPGSPSLNGPSLVPASCAGQKG